LTSTRVRQAEFPSRIMELGKPELAVIVDNDLYIIQRREEYHAKENDIGT
jgi:hypothetical protein